MNLTPAEPGDVIDGKYVIEGLIGEGGMGAVYAARHRQLDQLVAIKFLTARGSGVIASERFLREARAAARIRGEHVCRVLDIGEREGGVPYMVMEHLVGRDLAQELTERTRIPYAEAVDYVLDACKGLAEAHGAGIVHRDLKPGNLFVVTKPDGGRSVKVLDFGVSKIMDPESGDGLALTATTTLIGSPLYMSPEQLESSKDVDARTDIWALGVVLYELIAGRPPFVAETVPQLVNAVLHAEVASFHEHGISVPDELEVIVMAALTRDRNERLPTIEAFDEALRPFAAGVGASSVERKGANFADTAEASGTPASQSLGGAPTEAADRADRPSTGAETPANWERPSAAREGDSKRLWVAAAAAALLGALAIWWFAGTDPGEAPKSRVSSTPHATRVGPAEPSTSASSEAERQGHAVESPVAAAEEPVPVGAFDEGPADPSGAPDPAHSAGLPEGLVPDRSATGGLVADPTAKTGLEAEPAATGTPGLAPGLVEGKQQALEDGAAAVPEGGAATHASPVDSPPQAAADARERERRRRSRRRARATPKPKPVAVPEPPEASPEQPLGPAAPQGAIPEFGGRR